MNHERLNSEAQVLKRLLAETEPSPTGNQEHLDDETLALFAAGALTGAERDAAIEHLANCDHCRQVAALLMDDAEEAVVTIKKSQTAWLTPQVVGWVMAASLLVGVTGFVIMPAMMNRVGAPPDHLVNHPPVRPVDPARPPLEMLAFASQSRLTDYGFGLDGRSMTEYTTIKDIVPLPDGKDVESLLKRGHLLLSQGHTKLAGEVFQEATASFPKEPVAWLGAGLAQFVDRNPDAAEKNFRKALELDPQSQSAGMNLAITLEAKNDRAGALKEWKALLQQKLTPADREQIEQRVQAIEKESTEK